MFIVDLLNAVQISELPFVLVATLICGYLYVFNPMSHPLTKFYGKTEHDYQGTLPQESLDALLKHKYACSEYTPVDNLMNKWWNFAINLMPTSIAPNLITLIGFIGYAPTIFAIMYYSPDLTADCPSWVYFLGAFSVFLYQTMDALDGKQARKIGAASPLGQLFDHGIDAMAVAPGVVLIGSALNLNSFWLLVVMANLQGSFFAAQWLEKYLHTLVTSVGGIGVTEGQLMTMFTLILTGIKGRGIWDITINQVFGTSAYMALDATQWGQSYSTAWVSLLEGIMNLTRPYLCPCTHSVLSSVCQYMQYLLSTFNPLDLTMRALVLMTLLTGTIAMMCFSFYQVFEITMQKEGGFKKFIQASLELVAPISIIILNAAWYIASDTQDGSFFYNPILSVYVVGLIFTHITSQMIVSTIMQNKYEWYNQPTIAPLLLVVIFEAVIAKNLPTYLNVEAWRQWVFAILVISSVYVPINWASRTAQQVAKFLNIYVLSLGRPSTDQSN